MVLNCLFICVFPQLNCETFECSNYVLFTFENYYKQNAEHRVFNK